ncbi:hypothetical protein HYC85_031531 [Camellia sinensis]|uniref:Pyridoxamine kinase/Phosphomethylpyrimidine kinase domain-containing protein n=1 Tax=Camellia sinensis TaxID=4442 RepID=A0A7J7FSH6_CAMSI|nr:hypothetical protein HYC85_031531 [Camellia sinensis]
MKRCFLSVFVFFDNLFLLFCEHSDSINTSAFASNGFQGEAKSAQLIGQAIANNPAFITPRKIEAAREIAHTISNSANKVFLTSDELLLNLQETNLGTSTGQKEYLFPMANIVTPNLKEASALLGGVQLETVDDMRSAAKSIHDMGPRNVLVKGGDLASSLDAVDIFFDGDNFYELRSPRIRTRNTHGTGYTLASCITAELAKGSLMLSAVKVVHIVKSDSKLANNDLPVDIQRLRCRALCYSKRTSTCYT